MLSKFRDPDVRFGDGQEIRDSTLPLRAGGRVGEGVLDGTRKEGASPSLSAQDPLI